jgi:hypothetical protein
VSAPAVTNTGLVESDEPDPWAVVDPPGRAPADRPGLLPEEFWDARAVFNHIRRAAHSQACSGDVAFWATLSRLSAMLSHHIRAQTDIADRASLNLFAAPVGPSGTGKSTGARVARKMMPTPFEGFLDGMPIGTGEGIAEALMGTVDQDTGKFNKGEPVTIKVRKQVRHNVFYYVDEGATLAQIASRPGSTLGEAIRSAAIGESLGQTNASEERRRFIEAETYSMGMVIGFQPSTALPLLLESGKGTPQRFFWLWSIDPSIPRRGFPWPGGIEIPGEFISRDCPLDVTFPQRIKDELRDALVDRATGEVEVAELDGHAGLMKVKAAALFALLDGRTDASEEDWSLAEVAWACSCAVRDALIERAQREAAVQREREDDAKVRLAVRTHDAKSSADRDARRIGLAIWRHASRSGGISLGACRKALAGRDRDLFDKGLDYAEAEGWVFVERNQICVCAGVAPEGGQRS